MPVENLEEEGLPKNPNLELAQLKFHLESPKHKNDEAAKSTLLEAIKEDSKIPRLCSFSHQIWFVTVDAWKNNQFVHVCTVWLLFFRSKKKPKADS